MAGEAAQVQPPIELRRALAIAGDVRQTTRWLLRPYIERRATILMIGAEGTFKSFLALDWSLQIAMGGEPVVFLSAEGRGMSKRLRAWCKANRADARNGWVDTLNKLPFYAVERPLNLSDAETLLALQESIDHHKVRPSFVVIDTLTRNSDGLVERSNEDFLKWLNLVDNALRVRYDASVLLVHHVGHLASERARGPSSLSQATDANFLLTRPDPLRRVISVKSGRMKDCDPPPPFELEADIVELDEADEDGKQQTSLALRRIESTSAIVAKRPTGKAQRQLLAELETLQSLESGALVWRQDELRETCRGLGFHRNTARDAVLGLAQLGFLTPTIGGYRLTNHRTEGPKATEMTGSCTDNTTEMTERSLDLGLSCGPGVQGQA